MIHEIKGDLLDTNCQYICHQVNCQGKMNSGVAKAIRDKWPAVYASYMDWYNYHHSRGGEQNLHGKVQFISVSDNKTIVNMFAQLFYGYDERRYTSYDAFWICLEGITQTVPKGSSIAFPGRIGCVRGGANWDVIKNMIEVVLGKNYDVFIYYLEEEK